MATRQKHRQSGFNGQVSVIDRWLYWRGGCNRQVAVLESGCNRQVAVLESGCNRQVAVLESGCNRQVAVLERWL